MNKKITETVTVLAEPIAESLGLEIWDVEFSKQGPDYILCIYIEKAGGVTIDDCERMSRAIDPVLDEHDPIEKSYSLEVSSPGVYRILKRERDFIRYINSRVKVKTYKAIGNLPRTFIGTLTGYDGEKITVKPETGSPVEFTREECAFVRLEPEF